ncbi:MAG TPA: PEP-CTERM sorting domain-containing protein [Phycisphaerae bacterium]|nr:PEP-CTERM sorting domain-containing protein [Phycisphaerae bacterium]
MNRRLASALLYAPFVLFFFGLPAKAAVMTYEFTFSTSNLKTYFVSGFPQDEAAPEQTASGAFIIQFDPTLQYTFDSKDITLVNFSPSPLAETGVGFDYSPTGGNGNINIYSWGMRYGGYAFNTNEFYMNAYNLRATPTFGDFNYTQVGYDSAAVSVTGSVSLIPVPEPASLLTIGGGLLACCWVRKR